MVQKSTIKPKLLIIAGPTAVGKTKLVLDLYDQLNCELISADSMQVYKNCDIATAKIDKDLLLRYPHHNIDIKDINEEYNVAIFKKNTEKIIEDISRKGKLAIIVGGTGLYIESLIFPYNFGECSKNEEYRKQLEKLQKTHGDEALYNLLKEYDANLANKIDKYNTRRIIRALEVVKSNKEKSINISNNNNFEKDSPYDYYIIFLNKERNILYENINKRVDEMVNAGLVKEAKMVYDIQKNTLNELQISSAIGYKELYDYFESKSTLPECIEKIKQHSRNYAKRQITWYNRYSKNIERVKNENEFDHKKIVKQILDRYSEFKK